MRIEDGILYDVHREDLNADGSFVIPDGITRIGLFAFADCYSLTSITLPESITSIGDSAFYNCTGLTSKPNNYKAFLITETGGFKCLHKNYTVGKKIYGSW